MFHHSSGLWKTSLVLSLVGNSACLSLELWWQAELAQLAVSRDLQRELAALWLPGESSGAEAAGDVGTSPCKVLGASPPQALGTGCAQYLVGVASYLAGLHLLIFLSSWHWGLSVRIFMLFSLLRCIFQS